MKIWGVAPGTRATQVIRMARLFLARRRQFGRLCCSLVFLGLEILSLFLHLPAKELGNTISPFEKFGLRKPTVAVPVGHPHKPIGPLAKNLRHLLLVEISVVIRIELFEHLPRLLWISQSLLRLTRVVK